MSKGLRAMVVFSFIAVLAVAAFLVWKELAGPRAPAEEPAAAAARSGSFLYRSAEEWKPILEKRYLSLTELLGKKDWGGVSRLYGKDAVVHSKKAGTHFKGRHAIAFHFWKGMLEEKAGTRVVGFDIDVVGVFHVDFPVKLMGRSDNLMELVVFRGKLTTEASPAAFTDFFGIAGHIQSCPDDVLSEMY